MVLTITPRTPTKKTRRHEEQEENQAHRKNEGRRQAQPQKNLESDWVSRLCARPNRAVAIKARQNEALVPQKWRTDVGGKEQEKMRNKKKKQAQKRQTLW